MCRRVTQSGLRIGSPHENGSCLLHGDVDLRPGDVHSRRDLVPRGASVEAELAAERRDHASGVWSRGAVGVGDVAVRVAAAGGPRSSEALPITELVRERSQLRSQLDRDADEGATSCLAGKFKVISYQGSVQAAPGVNAGSSTVSVQLIR